MINNEKFLLEIKIMFCGFKDARIQTEIEPNDNKHSQSARRNKIRKSNSFNMDHTEMTKLNDDLKEF